MNIEDTPEARTKLGRKMREYQPQIWLLACTLAEVCQAIIGLSEGKWIGRANAMRKTIPDFTPERIRKLYGPGGVWYTQDWRGQRGNPPNLTTISETWLSLSAATGKEVKIEESALDSVEVEKITQEVDAAMRSLFDD